jgi:hypothetical protein
MMKHSKVEDMVKPRYELHVMYDHFAFYSVKFKIIVLANYLYL